MANIVTVQKQSVNKRTGRIHLRISVPVDMADEMDLKKGDQLFISSNLSPAGSPRYVLTKVQDDDDASYLFDEDDKYVFDRNAERFFMED